MVDKRIPEVVQVIFYRTGFVIPITSVSCGGLLRVVLSMLTGQLHRFVDAVWLVSQTQRRICGWFPRGGDSRYQHSSLFLEKTLRCISVSTQVCFSVSEHCPIVYTVGSGSE